MEDTLAILERLDRIEHLRRESAPASTLLEELRELMREAEDWSRLEGGEAGERAAARLRAALAPDTTAA